MMELDVIRQMQLERTIGELNTLKASYYNSMNPNDEKYEEVKLMIDAIVEELRYSV